MFFLLSKNQRIDLHPRKVLYDFPFRINLLNPAVHRNLSTQST